MNKPSENIINNVLTGLATEKEAKLVAEWFATIEGQEYLTLQMDKDFISIKEGTEEIKIDHKIPSEQMFDAVMKHIRKKRLRKILFRVAAVILPFILIAGLLYQIDTQINLLGKAEYNEIYVPKGERIQVVFQDGSRAYLNSDTKIRYPQKFGLTNRNIYIQGEAYFIIEPNSKRPFIVNLDSASIQVLGTSFDVKAYPEEDKISVTLDEGKINFTTWNNSSNLLNPKDILIFDKKTGDCTITSLEETNHQSDWKNNTINFNQEPLQQVMTKLNRWYNVEFIVKDSEVYAYSYTLTTQDKILEKVLAELEKVAPVQFIQEGNTVLVKMKQ